MPSVVRRAGDALLSLFFPPHCANCGADTDGDVHLCGPCSATAQAIEPPLCLRCSQPYPGAIERDFVCANCLERRWHFECAVAPYLSRGIVRELIHRFKYEHERQLRVPLAHWLADALADERLRDRPIEAIVPVPLHPTRFRERGFNQARLLADLLGARAGLPVCDCLRRTRYTTTQTRLDRQERMENLRNAFCVRHTDSVQNRHLLLVDDVFTTGSTVDECARVLRLAGAASVRVATVARG